MTRTIPARMAECWRDDHGRPVPYINIWSGEMPEERWTIRYDPNVRAVALFTAHGQGSGEPDFTKQAMQRQRECR